MNDITNPTDPLANEPTSPNQPVQPTAAPTVIPAPTETVPVDSLSANASVVEPTVTLPAEPLPAADATPFASTAAETPSPTTNDATDANSTSPKHAVGAVIWAFALGIFNWLIVPAAIVLVLHFFVFQAFHVVGHSMVPTLDQNDYLIISKVDASLSRLSRLWGQSGAYIPKRDEIIVFRYPGDPSKIFVKRVIATPGEHVVVKAGKVTVFNSTHPQGLDPDQGHDVSDPISLGDVDEIVQPGKVFVMGDNRSPNGSFDSRDWGELPSDNIIGKALLRLLPFNKLKVIGTS